MLLSASPRRFGTPLSNTSFNSPSSPSSTQRFRSQLKSSAKRSMISANESSATTTLTPTLGDSAPLVMSNEPNNATLPSADAKAAVRIFGRMGVLEASRGPTPADTEAFGIAGVLEDERGATPTKHKADGRDQTELVASFVASHADATVVPGRIRCEVTGHEIVPVYDLLVAHWGGKRYRRAMAAHTSPATRPQAQVTTGVHFATTNSASGGKIIKRSKNVIDPDECADRWVEQDWLLVVSKAEARKKKAASEQAAKRAAWRTHVKQFAASQRARAQAQEEELRAAAKHDRICAGRAAQDLAAAKQAEVEAEVEVSFLAYQQEQSRAADEAAAKAKAEAATQAEAAEASLQAAMELKAARVRRKKENAKAKKTREATATVASVAAVTAAPKTMEADVKVAPANVSLPPTRSLLDTPPPRPRSTRRSTRQDASRSRVADDGAGVGIGEAPRSRSRPRACSTPRGQRQWQLASTHSTLQPHPGGSAGFGTEATPATQTEAGPLAAPSPGMPPSPTYAQAVRSPLPSEARSKAVEVVSSSPASKTAISQGAITSACVMPDLMAEIEAMKVVQLRAALSAVGEPTSGLKPALAARLKMAVTPAKPAATAGAVLTPTAISLMSHLGLS